MSELELQRTLGVSDDDGASAVRHAYRDLTRRCRPVTDAIPLHVRAIERAFEILADPGGGARRLTPRALHPAPLQPDAIDLLADFEPDAPSRDEVWSAFRRNFEPAGPPKSGRVTALALRIRAAAGQVLPHLAVPIFRPCPACHALGSVDAWACASCDGTGLAEDRAPVALPAAGAGEERLDLGALGVLTPVLRVLVIAA